MLRSDKEQERRWAEHVEEVFNRDNSSNLPHIQEAPEDLDISVEPPTTEEIVAPIKKLKTQKTPGHDQLNAELIKPDPELASNLYFYLYLSQYGSKRSFQKTGAKAQLCKFPRKVT